MSTLCRLLPVIIEHTIDERSPLIGHTFDSLVAVSHLCLFEYRQAVRSHSLSKFSL